MKKLAPNEITHGGTDVFKSEQKRVAPPRRKRKCNIENNSWSSINASTIGPSFFPYAPCTYGYPYNCGFAIPIFPLPFNMHPQDIHVGKIASADIQIGEDFQKSIVPFEGSHIGECTSSKIDHDRIVMTQNGNLFRNESLPNMHSMVENAIAQRPQSVNTVRHPKTGNICAEELINAFRTLEENVNNFKKFISQTTTEDYSHNKSNPNSTEYKSISSICSSPCEILPSQKQKEKLTFSQHIEDITNQSKQTSFDLSIPLHTVTDELTWVLKPQMNKGNYFNVSSNNSKFNEYRNKVVITLCFGKGFDQEDWLLFQQLVSFPFCIKEKMKFLNAEIICTENINAGVAFLRNSLLSISKYGETLLNLRSEDFIDSYIHLNQEQNWKNIKGCMEILQLFGYCRQGPYQLCYISTSMSFDKVFVAELTLDILILAEEFRLYLDGLHSNPTFITKLYNRDSTFSRLPASLKRNNDNVPIDRKAITDVPNECVSCEKKEDNNFTTQSIKISKNETSITTNNITNISSNDIVHDTEKLDEIQSFSPKLPPKVKKNVYSKAFNHMEDIKLKKTTAQPNTYTIQKKEDHIYEEISEVKGDVSRPLSNSPPPLPKKEIELITRNKLQDNILSKKYARKRPAPMPPFFNTNFNSVMTKEPNHHLEKKENQHPEICKQCGKPSIKTITSFRRKNCDNPKEKIFSSMETDVTNFSHFTPRNYYGKFDKDQIELSHKYFTLSNDNYSRSLDNFYDVVKKITNSQLHSASMPVIASLASNFIGNHSQVEIRRDTSVELFENNKNLILNNTPNAFVSHNNGHTQFPKELSEKPMSEEYSQNEFKVSENSIHETQLNNLLTFDNSIPFIDGEEELPPCFQYTIGNEETTATSTTTPLKAQNVDCNFGYSLNNHSISAESLEVKEILRKCTSDSVLMSNEIQLNDSNTSYREPIIFKINNSQKIDNYNQRDEDRYEIPDVPLHERNGRTQNMPMQPNQLQNKTRPASTKEIPSRPYRKLKCPPIPPKPKEKPPPPLPPKSLLGSITTRSIASNLCPNRKKSSSSSKAGGSLTDHANSSKSTGLVFVGNKPGIDSVNSIKPKKCWPNVFCSCLPKT